MNKHTQGEWKVRCDTNKNGVKTYSIFDKNWIKIAVTNTETNARLIAVAPNLLEVCKKSYKYFEKYHRIIAMEDCRQAIAKAEGKEE